MANYIEETDIDASTYVTPGSRYLNSDVIYYTEAKRLTFKTYKRQPYVQQEEDRFMVISKGVEFRPDLVAHRVYGVVDFWWKLMEVNGMKDITEFKSGVNIRIPSIVF